MLAIKDFHVWALSPGKVMLSAYVLTEADCEDTDDVLLDLQKVLGVRIVAGVGVGVWVGVGVGVGVGLALG